MQISHPQKAWNIYFLFTLFSLTLSLVPIDASLAEQVHGLLKWKTSLQNQTSLSSWVLPRSSSSFSHCYWKGILCDEGKMGTITGINLTESNLKGTLDEFPFSTFPNLTYI